MLPTFRPRKQWIQLEHEADWARARNQLLLNRLEPGTRDNYSVGKNTWNHFCTLHHIEHPLPTTENLQKFITQLTLSGYKYGTIRNYLTGIRSWMADIGHIDIWEQAMGSIVITHTLQASKKLD